ncbi:MAG: hypothetical protein ACOYU3_08090 [Bacillota bacterium]
MSEKNHGFHEKDAKTQKRIKNNNASAKGDEQTGIDKTYQSGLTMAQIDRSIKEMDNAALMESIANERKKLNEIAQKALEYDGNLDVEIVREQNRVVESLINEALLRRLEGFDEQE